MTPSSFLLLLQAQIKMRLVFLSLLVDSLQYLIRIGIDIEIHLLVVMLDQIFRIRLQLFVQGVVVFQIACFSRYYMHDHLLTGRILGCILNMDICRLAPVEALE